MAQYKNINKGTNVVSVGRTAPVPRGVQTKNNSLPVVLASDADAVPVVEQNKVLSEVALSLLGIPRSEVALGIFADVNTYDVNPSEWSIKPLDKDSFTKTSVNRPFEYNQVALGTSTFQHGLTHIPEEAGALVEAPPGKTAVLTSKRFFRYQPGRVSAATFGVKESNVSPNANPEQTNRNPAIRKFGIYDNFDGYYWETRDTGKGDQFSVTRRTQSIIDHRNSNADYTQTNLEDYGVVGKGQSNEFVCTMTADTASVASGKTITIPLSDIDNTPQVGMTIKNITINGVGHDGKVADTDLSPIFDVSTVVTSVAKEGTDLTVGINNSIISNNVFGTTTEATTISGRRFKFTKAGDLAIVRDSLLMTQAGIYDTNLLKDETLNEIASISVDAITFNSPGDGLSNSPGGLRVNEVFEFGQLVEYTTNASTVNFATDGTGATGETLMNTAENSPSILMIREINVSDNSIKLSHIPSATDTTQTNESPKKFVPLSASAGNFGSTKHFIKTPVPFVFPEIISADTGNVYDIQFPYSRSFRLDREAITANGHKGTTEAGLIDTNIADSGGNVATDKFNNFKTDVNDLNRGLTACTMKSSSNTSSGVRTTPDKEGSVGKLTSGWRYFVQQNVKPDFYGVYEYKVPRSRFSFDSLDGSGNNVFYSDIVKDGGKTRFPGQAVGGDDGTRTSLWDIDFSKVIMKKIEFSWYGAVGALFLAYVPVGNGEARWVRVHHLRASNQLKVASLGNATLPLTYTVFGGGTPKQFGRSTFTASSYSGGKSLSEFITKYGSSYYIDGGDRGTVKLFNFAPVAPSNIDTSTFSVTFNQGSHSANFFTFNYSPNSYRSANPTDFFIGGTVTNPAGTQTAKVEWVERKGISDTPYVASMYLNKAITNTATEASSVVALPGVNLYGLESKREIQSSQGFNVRNRVQVYPTKLSVGMQTPGTRGQTENTILSLKKNVIFQTDEVHKLRYDIGDGAPTKQDNFKFTGTDDNLTLSGSGLPTRLVDGTNVSPINGGSVNPSVTGGIDCPSIPIGTEIFGHVRVSDEFNNEFTLFSKIKKVDVNSSVSPVFDFIPLEPYSGTVRFKNNSFFTHSMQYTNVGAHITPDSPVTKNVDSPARLSSVVVNKESRRSIPNTGTQVASFFLEDGSEYFDLSAYFDYNKDYISFPLTDVPDNLFLECKVNSPTVNEIPKVAASLTWEEQ